MHIKLTLLVILIAVLVMAGFPHGASASAIPNPPGSDLISVGSHPRPCIRAFYIVRPGDTLFRIGLRFGVNYLILAQFNHLRNPNRIFFGMPLLIPCSNIYLPRPAPYSPGYPPPPPPQRQPPSPGAQSNVSIVDFRFAPATITVRMGQTVVWRNNGSASHTTTSDAGLWDSETLNPGQTFPRTFATAGTFTYHCEIHPSMRGSIVVTR